MDTRVVRLFATLAATACAIAVVATIRSGAAAQGSAVAPRPTRASSPTVTVLVPPDYWGAYAIWGSTGVDRRGHVWIGLTSNDEKSGSAHLYEFDPASATFTDRGNVAAELERLGLRRPGETQMKIHSRIVEAADGYQYFASMDESGEEDDGSKFPTWGGHLWRRRGAGAAGWEHLAATREALIAVAAGGPYVYSLGYFGHVLYQFDTRTRKIRSVTVGAAGGHVSRNFFVDARGHAFVPRVTEAGGRLAASLVEFDPNLAELGSTPLLEYFERGRDDSHGMVSVQPGADGTWFFATGKGRLYQVTPASTGPSAVADLGWFHPAGSRYTPSLFRDEATGTLYGVAYGSNYGDERFDWVTRPPGGRVTVAPLPYGDAAKFPTGAVLYGSITHDAAGRFYVVGSMKYKPVILQVTPVPTAPDPSPSVAPPPR